MNEYERIEKIEDAAKKAMVICIAEVVAESCDIPQRILWHYRRFIETGAEDSLETVRQYVDGELTSEEERMNLIESEEEQRLFKAMAETIAEYRDSLPKAIVWSFDRYTETGDPAMREKVRGYLYDQTGEPAFARLK